ncbi:hypothetical protein LCGC14_1352390 [marine sediment metagenome]|uniref:Uncharacterized protein n=1 Tax=marine sediment metagenome TaxID=412755 RepID=A0A0F9KAI0_9ZZZZ
MNLSEEALALIPDREWRINERGDGSIDYSVLDHGYLRVKDTWGSDEEIVETARMSTSKGFLGWEPGECPSCKGTGRRQDLNDFSLCDDCGGKGKIPGDAKLLKYLYEHKHSTPFEFAGLTIEVQAPLMVFREWHRHRVPFGYSEMSARYVKMPNLHYVPSVERIIASAKKSKNKQASGAGAITIPNAAISDLASIDVRMALRTEVQTEEDTARLIQQLIRSEQEQIYKLYEQLISFGVAKEVARLDTPVSRYSRMRATGNLRGWLGFLTLRMDPHAQFEIRQFAWCVADAIAMAFPRTYELFFKGMTPVFEPEMAPRKLFADALTVIEEAEHRVSDWHKVSGLPALPEVRDRLRKALGRVA